MLFLNGAALTEIATIAALQSRDIAVNDFKLAIEIQTPVGNESKPRIRRPSDLFCTALFLPQKTAWPPCLALKRALQAPPPDHDVHDGTPYSGMLHIIVPSGGSV
jgi:hypothetical protein